MLNTLFFIREQKGFILPFVLFTMVLIMLIVVSGIQIYKNNMQLTHQHIEQLKIETLFQSAYALFQQQLQDGDVTLSGSSNEKHLKTYTFPDGEVTLLSYLAEEETLNDPNEPLYHLTFRVIIDELSYPFTYVPVPEIEDNSNETGNNDNRYEMTDQLRMQSVDE